MLKVKFCLFFLFILILISPASAGMKESEWENPGINQITEVTSPYLQLSSDEIEFGDILSVEYGFTDNSSQFVGNVSYELVLLDGDTDVNNFTLSEENYTTIINGTSDPFLMTFEVDTLPTGSDPILPDNYFIFLTSTEMNSTNYNITAPFQVFPVEGANIDITFSDLDTNEELTSPIDLIPEETREFEVTLTNSGSGNALDIFFGFVNGNNPIEFESAELSSGIQLSVLSQFEQVSYNFSVTAPDFGIAGLQFSLTYDRISGRTLEVSPTLVFHILPEIRGVIVPPEVIISGENIEFEVLLENEERQNFTLKFFISSPTFTFSPIETQFYSVAPGFSKIIFNGITFTNGTVPASLIMTYFDPLGNDQVNIEIYNLDLEVQSPVVEPETNDQGLTILLILLYLVLLIVIILILVSKRLRKFILDNLIQRTFVPDIDFSKKRAIIDGSNVAWEDLDEDGKPKIENIVLAIETLEKYGFEEIIVVADAALRYQISNKKDLDEQSHKGKIKVLPAKVDGDSFILRLSRDTGSLILTNDLYREYRNDFKWIDERRIPYSILTGRFYLHPIYEID